MKCPRCQQDNPPQAKFCLECATPLVAVTTATTMYREMDMRFWLEKAEAELKAS